MGTASIEIDVDGKKEVVMAHYEDVALDDRIEPRERQRAMRAIAEEIAQRGIFEVGFDGDAPVTLRETSPGHWESGFLFLNDTFHAPVTTRRIIRPSEEWQSAVLRLWARGPQHVTLERFQHLVGQAQSLIGWDGHGLYELIVHSPEARFLPGVMGQQQIENWQKGLDPIQLPEVDEGLHREIERELERNRLTTGDLQLARQYFDVRERIREHNDPDTNKRSGTNPNTGADTDLKTLAMQEVNDLSNFMVSNRHWDGSKKKEDTLKMVAAYLTIIDYYLIASGRYSQRLAIGSHRGRR